MRTVKEIMDQALENTKKRLRTTKVKYVVTRRTGNKKALHQKGKNRRISWIS
ncbi:hypothetical protein [Clostridium puniceum]|uniref:hypothetical protein n=1 Tax=Clostridium puniceum TaxID=29367 RepID=UPI001301871C|nr:hypothetical protein [Clostridium puniceum]